MKFSIACRGSKLSLAQVEIFESKIKSFIPEAIFERHIVKTKGDIIQNVALDEVEGKNFFANDVQQTMLDQNIDFAVHSLKDVSDMDFFENQEIAFLERAIPNDVALFKQDIHQKLVENKDLIIGTSSPRRALYSLQFLEKALPQINTKVTLKPALIRGNVDTRLRKLLEGNDYDGTILAFAGIERLLQTKHSDEIKQYLDQLEIMILPLTETPPSCNQGIIIAECNKQNRQAAEVLLKLNNKEIEEVAQLERQIVRKKGKEGCSQLFGVLAASYKSKPYLYTSGKDKSDIEFSEWQFNNELDMQREELISSSQWLNNHIERIPSKSQTMEINKHCFVSNFKSYSFLRDKRTLTSSLLWCAGSATWFKLAKEGHWVSGCADGFGFDYLRPIFSSQLVNASNDALTILTNSSSKKLYDGDIHVVASYDMNISQSRKALDVNIKGIYWTSFLHYLFTKEILPDDIMHFSGLGRTYDLLQKEGLNPIPFPTNKAFYAWKNTQ